MKKELIISVMAVIVAVIILGFLFLPTSTEKTESAPDETTQTETEKDSSSPAEEAEQDENNIQEEVKEETIQIILNAELNNVATGEDFKISDFSGKPVLLESFAVWCPTCTKQQKEIKKFHEDPEIGDSVVSISLNTDPNEDTLTVLEHIQNNGFDWYYSISPVEMTEALIDEFGIGIVNAPSAPTVLICNGEARKLDSGVKSVEELKNEIETCNG